VLNAGCSFSPRNYVLYHIKRFYTVTTGRKPDDILDASRRMTPPVLQASFLRQNSLCTMSAIFSVSFIMRHVKPTKTKSITAYRSDVMTRLLRHLVIRHTTTSLSVGHYFFVLSCCVVLFWLSPQRLIYGDKMCLMWDVFILICAARLSGRQIFSELLSFVCVGLM
jgi:hypothetical protein